MGGEDVLHILHRDLALRHQAPGQIVRLGGPVRLRAVPAEAGGVEVAQHVPGPGRVVAVVGVGPAAEGGAHVKGPIPGQGLALGAHGQIQVVFRDEIQQIGGAEVILLSPEGVHQIKEVDALLVGHDHVAVVGDPLGDPVVPADGLQPPDLVHVLEADAVHLVGAVLLQQRAQAQNALPGRADVGQHDGEHVLLPDAAGHQRVGPLDAGIGGDGLGLAHGDVGGVDPGLAPDALVGQGVGHGGVAQGILRQLDLHA